MKKLDRVILDTSVLIKRCISREFGNLSESEKEVLSSILSEKAIITPHILAEFSNLIKKQYTDPKFSELHKSEFIMNLREEEISKEKILKSSALKFGVADAALAILAKETHTPLLTFDWDLTNWCRKNNISALHVHELAFNK